MVGIIKFFGWFSVIVGAMLLFVGVVSIVFWVTFIPLGASALLGGALLIVFARIVELLEALNEKLVPVFTIAKTLESKYQPDRDSESAARELTDADLLKDPPADAKIFSYKNRRVVQFANGQVIAQTLTGGARRFSSLQEFQDFIA